MVGAAERDEIVGVMGAVLGARRSVVNIDKRSVLATGHPAATGVASKHLASNRRRNGLLGACGAVGANRHASIAAHVGGMGVDVSLRIGVHVGVSIRVGVGIRVPIDRCVHVGVAQDGSD